ncbi:MAG: SusD/RagB family nutrient-binding outer membrane lipoprotein [Phocaeicola sp.]
MKINNILKGALVLSAMSISFASCSEDIMDGINKNANNVTDVPARLILTDVMTATAFSNVGGDFNTYLGIYVEHQIGSHNQTFNAEYRNGEPQASATFNNVWRRLYVTLKDAKIAIAKCSEGGSEPGNFVTLGIAQTLAAYNLAVLTDMFGDAPWSEACDYTISMTPKIDRQEDIYRAVLAYLDGAIENLQKTDLNGIGAQDLIYGGDKDKWLKTAYGLKARYTMRLMLKGENKEAIMQTVLDCIGKSYTSASEQCSYDKYNTGVNINPYFGFYWSRAGVVASRSMFDKLVERKDPRISRLFMEPQSQTMIASATDPLLNLAKHGDLEQSQQKYTTPMYVAAQSAPTHLLSYHELLFLKAEALVNLNNIPAAKEVLKEAVVVAIANSEKSVLAALSSVLWEGFSGVTENITPEIAASYFDDEVAALFDANPLKETMLQKYIAFHGANGETTECYNDVRRMRALNHDFYAFQNPNKFPLRCPYGNSDTTTNPNVQAAYGNGDYVYTENVWWAGGSR